MELCPVAKVIRPRCSLVGKRTMKRAKTNINPTASECRHYSGRLHCIITTVSPKCPALTPSVEQGVTGATNHDSDTLHPRLLAHQTLPRARRRDGHVNLESNLQHTTSADWIFSEMLTRSSSDTTRCRHLIMPIPESQIPISAKKAHTLREA